MLIQNDNPHSVKIIYRNKGIACRIGNTIYVHKDLPGFDIALFSQIIKHELEHTPGLTKKDIMMDLSNTHLEGMKAKYYAFILTHPSSWTELLPFDWIDRKIIINPLILGLWFGFIAGSILIWKIL